MCVSQVSFKSSFFTKMQPSWKYRVKDNSLLLHDQNNVGETVHTSFNPLLKINWLFRSALFNPQGPY